MKIYIAHSKQINYIQDLYEPIKKSSFFSDHEILFPHDNNIDWRNPREFYQTIDLLIAEVSAPATGLGIELGWAYDSQVPIYCIYQKDCHISSSILSVSDHFSSYSSYEEMLQILSSIIQDIRQHKA